MSRRYGLVAIAAALLCVAAAPVRAQGNIVAPMKSLASHILSYEQSESKKHFRFLTLPLIKGVEVLSRSRGASDSVRWGVIDTPIVTLSKYACRANPGSTTETHRCTFDLLRLPGMGLFQFKRVELPPVRLLGDTTGATRTELQLLSLPLIGSLLEVKRTKSEWQVQTLFGLGF